MKKQFRTKLQLQRTTIRLLEGRIAAAGGGLTSTEKYSRQAACSDSCTCSNSCWPCVA